MSKKSNFIFITFLYTANSEEIKLQKNVRKRAGSTLKSAFNAFTHNLKRVNEKSNFQGKFNHAY